MRELTPEELVKAERQLAIRLNMFRGCNLTPRLIARLEEMTREYRQRYRLQGMNFPALCVVVLPSVGYISVYRRDRTRWDIEAIVVTLAKQFPDVTPLELAQAMHRAFPDLKPWMAEERAEKVRAIEAQQAASC